MNEEREAIENLKKQGVIRESNSPWASPIVLVRKKNGKIRPCCDYRILNKYTVKDAYPLPRTQDCLDAIAGSVFFSTLDMTSGYNQVPIKEEDIHKTAFVTHHGFWEWTTMSFGMTNSPATFQRVMELALNGLQWTTCLIYLDDVIIFGKTFEEHLQRLDAVLARVEMANLKLKVEKCVLFTKEVEFLGHVVNQNGIKPNPHNTDKIAKWQVPETVTQVRQFLGLCSYYRRFVKGFATIAKPLTDLTHKNATLVWTEECQKAFDTLKHQLLGENIMAYPQENGEYILDTDASEYGIGTVLSQIQDGKERVIAYASRSLNKAERNYCVTDRELLAVRYFTDYFRHYLLGRHFLVRSDHQALRWLFTLKNPKDRVARWIEILSAFNFSVEYRPGNKHGNADGMSRCINPKDCQCPDQDNLEDLKCGPCKKCKRRASAGEDPLRTNEQILRQVSSSQQTYFSMITVVFWQIMIWISSVIWKSQNTRTELTLDRGSPNLPKQEQDRIGKVANLQEPWFQGYSNQELQARQERDPPIKQLLQWKKTGRRPSGVDVASASPEVRSYWNYWDSLELHGNLLFKRASRRNGIGSYLQFLTPKSLRQTVLQTMHNSLSGAHLGRRKTTERVAQRYHWFGLSEDVKVWISRCDICSSVKKPSKKLRAKMGDMRLGAPMDRLSVDILGPLPLSRRGNKYILVVTDAFTKWVEIFPVPDQSAETCAKCIVNEVICRLGCSIDLHSDQGRNFESDLVKNLCKLLGIRKTRTAPRNPKCNGVTERFNCTLVQMIKCFIKDDQTDWDENLSCLASAYRASVNETTQFTPNLLMLGREVMIPHEIIAGTQDPTPTSYGDFVDALRQNLQKAHDTVRKYLKSHTERQIERTDPKINLHRYKTGDLVWCIQAPVAGLAPKLQRTYQGPYLVIKRFNDNDYLIQKNKQGKLVVLNHDHLKPYEGEKQLKWASQAIRKFKSRQ